MAPPAPAVIAVIALLHRRRRTTLAVLCLLAGAPVLTGCGSSSSGSSGHLATHAAARPTDPPRTPGAFATPLPSPVLPPSPVPRRPLPQLPGGGRVLFPAHRVVLDYGGATGPALGVLGQGSPDQAAAAVERRAAQWRAVDRSSMRTVVGGMELIVSTAQGSPGADGTWSALTDLATVRRYLVAARAHHELLVLDLQPGRATFPQQLRAFAPLLAQPDVGVGLDAEWRMGPTEIPGKVFGHVEAAEVNQVSATLAAIVRQHHLPEKLLVLHQFRTSMLPDRAAIIARPGLATVLHADGNGDIRTKTKVFGILAFPPAPFHVGIKLFLKQDPVLMSPAQVLALVPQPDMITYQ